MGKNIVTATVAIEGTRPLLQHHFTPDAIPLEKRERTGVAGNDPEEWKKTVLMTSERQLYLPGTYFFSCLREAAYLTTRKRQTQRDIVATLQIHESVVLIRDRFVPKEPEFVTQYDAHERPEVYVDVSAVKNPGSGARNVRYRVATSPGWCCHFHLLWDKTVVATSLMESICIDAGTLVGIGDGRTMGFGRFEVKQFDCADTS
ncbi:MAG: hypothetical protein ACFB12_13420 [Leptolyngbyaceae cyanobacterium]